MKGTRPHRISEILRILAENNGEMMPRQLYRKMARVYGISFKTFWNYLEALKEAGKIDYPIRLLGKVEEKNG